MSVVLWNEQAETVNAEERAMLLPLIDVLKRRRWIGPSSVVRKELFWNGRRVDLATRGISGATSAYELKIGSFHRVLEQAMYNRLSFDRSWIVVTEMPHLRNLEQARENGIGVFLLTERMQQILPAVLQTNSIKIRSKLAETILRGVL